MSVKQKEKGEDVGNYFMFRSQDTHVTDRKTRGKEARWVGR